MPKRTKTRFSARMIDGARPADKPGFIKPQLSPVALGRAT
jgi:hypothetical protein